MRRMYYSKSKVIAFSLVILIIALCAVFCIFKVQSTQTAKNNLNLSAIAEGVNLQSDIYYIEEGYISRILPETTLRDLKNNLDNEEITVTKKDGNLLKDTEFVGTGMKLVYGQKEYKLAIIDDLNGDGKAGITDLTQMKLISVGLRAKPVNEYAKAGDINNDGKVSITDLTKSNLASVNLIDIIAPVSFTPEVVSTKDTITIQGETADSNSGVKEYWFEINNNGWVSNTDKLNTKYTFTGLNMETKYTVRMKAVDNAGNVKTTKRVEIETLNEENANISIVASTTEWTNQNILVAINFNSNVAKEKKQISLDDGNTWVDYTAPITVEKNMTIKARVVNSSGVILEEQEKAITNIDKLAPQEFTATAEVSADSIIVTAQAEDAQASEEYGVSGIKEYEYTLINGRWKDTYVTTDTTYTFSDLALGTEYVVKVKAIDNAGNERMAKNSSGDEENGEKVTIGTIDDLIELAGGITINATPSTENWTNGDITVEVTYPDIDGLTKEISVDNGYSWKTYSGVETIEGNTTVKARMKDSKGQTSTEQSLLIDKIDKLAPKDFDVTVETTGDTITLTASTADAEAANGSGVSGIAGYKFKIDEEEWSEIIENGEHTFTGLTEGQTYKIIVKAIDNAGNETIARNCKNGENEGLDITPTQIPDYYGKEVTNYSAGGVSDWRIFHKDEEGRIYLITDDYITYEQIPESRLGKKLNNNNPNHPKAAWFKYERDDLGTNILDDYTGSEWIKTNTNTNAQKWLKKYLDLNPSSTNNSIKAVAYMMDTDSWNTFVNSTYAEYAIGGPTIELFCASYKVTHPNKFIECDNVDTNGYSIRWNGDISYSNYITGVYGDFGNIYRCANEKSADGIWIASPSSKPNGNSLISTGNAEVDSADYYITNRNFRPIVCLKSGYDLVKNEDGTYSIEDKGKPTLTVEGNTDEWSKTKTLTITASDAESGIASVTVDGISQTLTDGVCTYTVSSNKTYTIIATDNNGNTTTEEVEITKIDNTAPTITFSKESNETELTTQEVQVTPVDEESGIEICKYLWSTSATAPTEEEKYIHGEFTTDETISQKYLAGEYYLHVYMKDNAGNTATASTSGKFKFRYEIWNEEDFIHFMNDVELDYNNVLNFYGKTVYVMDDIEVAPTTVLGEGRFDGTLEGNGHKISGINRNTTLGGGNLDAVLFADLWADGTIRNLGLENIEVTVVSNNNNKEGNNYYGGFAGRNWGTIENCYITGTINFNNTNDLSIGGLVGTNSGSGTVKNSYFQGTINGNSNMPGYLDCRVGGIAGGSYSNTSIEGCYFNGELNIRGTHVNGNNCICVGGIVGVATGRIENCYTEKDSTISSEGYVGGIAGEIYEGGIVQKCYNLATVKGTSRAGGICGTMSKSVGLPMDGSSTSDTTSKIENCYNRGTVISLENYAGGIVGMMNNGATNEIVNYCYNTGNITGSIEIGGIVGNVEYTRNGQINNSYNIGTVSTSNADGIIGGVCGVLGSSMSSNNLSIYNSYNEGNIGVGKYYGGIVGKLGNNGTVTSCKYKRGTTDAGVGVITGDYGVEIENSRGDISGQAEVATSLPTVLSIVNGGLEFKVDSRNINDGYPILMWQ